MSRGRSVPTVVKGPVSRATLDAILDSIRAGQSLVVEFAGVDAHGDDVFAVEVEAVVDLGKFVEVVGPPRRRAEERLDDGGEPSHDEETT